jgi:pimeloyl-ACP methyl ester carboxylesterase
MTPPTGPISQFYVSQRLRLHYVDWGNEDAPPLVLVHGGLDHCRNWDWVAERLRRDWHVLAPDLRGHGDSQWVTGSNYAMIDYVYDLAQLVHQKKLAPVTLVGHSLGGAIALAYTGIHPDAVAKVVAIEGLGPSPKMLAERAHTTIDQRMTEWIAAMRGLAGRTPRKYASIEQAFARMQAENPRLTPAQARHLTIHGVNQNEDGTYSWKFDNYVRAFSPYSFNPEDARALWARIACPALLVRGAESWASNPLEDGRASHFRDARVVNVDRAGHWVHHDQLEEFGALVERFLADPAAVLSR